MRRHSTGALSDERRKRQEKRYHESREYDYVIIGTGMSALTAGSLLANAGMRVCMLEAHDIPGGYAHTFEMQGYHFCAQVHYIWGCAPGQRIYQFLEKLGLEKEIEFYSYDPTGYDVASLPDGNRVKIPYGFDKLIENIDEHYPGEKENLTRFLETLEYIVQEMSALPQGKVPWWKFLTDGYKFYHLIKYRNKTLQYLFDEFQLSKPLQTILSADSGDFGSPPNELSIFAYAALFSGYNAGTYYPKKHYKFFIERIAQFIEEKPGCDIFYEEEVTALNLKNGKISDVVTESGKRFVGKNFICNMDPQKASQMIGLKHFPRSYRKPLSYDYSPAAFNIYLGIKDADLRDHGFGNYNIWHCGQWDMNQMWKEMLENNHKNPLIFLSTPTLHTNEPGEAPDGRHVLEITTLASYKIFKELHDNDPKGYRKAKRDLAQHLIQTVEEKYFKGLSKHIDLKVVGTPTTSEEFVFAPYGNAYGSTMTPKHIGLGRLKAHTPFSNLFWCNASAGYAGIYGTVSTGCKMYATLTGDDVINGQEPSVDKAIAYAKTRELRPLVHHI